MFRDLKPRTLMSVHSGAPATSTPEGWTSVRLAQVGTLFKGKGGSREDDAEDGVACIRYGDLYKHNDPRFDRVRTRVAPRRVSAYTKIARGDIVFALSGELLEDIGKSAVCLLDEVTVCGGDLAVLRPHSQLNPEFAAYVLDSPRVCAQKAQHGRGDIIVHISMGALKRLTFDVPPLDEQAAIVKYLEHAHARIDRAIAAKRKLIALLEEQKQSIINQAVTRGLDPTVPMKDSGIPWLGHIPAAWELQPARRLLRAVVRPPDGDSGPQFSMTRAHGLVPTDALGAGAGRAANGENLQVCEVGDFVLNKYRAHLGLFWCARERGRVTRNYTVFERRVEISTEYIEMLMHSTPYSDAFRIMARGVGDGMSPLYTSTFYGIPVVFPPLRVQAEIALLVAEAMRASAAVASRLSDEIRLLLEFRTRLTSDVVSGQLDVREVASTLPDLVEPSPVDADSGEDELLDELDEVLEEADA